MKEEKIRKREGGKGKRSEKEGREGVREERKFSFAI